MQPEKLAERFEKLVMKEFKHNTDSCFVLPLFAKHRLEYQLNIYNERNIEMLSNNIVYIIYRSAINVCNQNYNMHDTKFLDFVLSYLYIDVEPECNKHTEEHVTIMEEKTRGDQLYPKLAEIAGRMYTKRYIEFTIIIKDYFNEMVELKNETGIAAELFLFYMAEFIYEFSSNQTLIDGYFNYRHH